MPHKGDHLEFAASKYLTEGTSSNPPLAQHQQEAHQMTEGGG
jgi:hypothetical protein